MNRAHPNADELLYFLQLLYGDIDEGYLVESHPSPTRRYPDGRAKLDSTWHDLRTISLNEVARHMVRLACRTTIYHGCVVQHPSREPQYWRRSWNASAHAVPGLWFDLDLRYGQHAQDALPATDGEALDFLFTLPTEPSLIIHSGGGLYGWWLFREPCVITSPEEHTAIATLSERFTATLFEAGKHHGWTFDTLNDLARVLRPAGSINCKYGTLVTLLHEAGVRYNPSDFDWLLPVAHAPHSTRPGTPIAGQPDILVVAEAYGTTLAKKSAEELCGAHPVHGSSTGTNLDVNIHKQVWHCHRHTSGGNAITLIAVCEGILECEAAKPGGLRGAPFWEAVKVAWEKFGADIFSHAEPANIWGHSVAASDFSMLARQDARTVAAWQ